MKKAINFLEGLPWIVKLILVILWGFYANVLRLLRSIDAGNILGIVLSIVLLCVGWVAFPIWILDIIFVILGKRFWWIA